SSTVVALDHPLHRVRQDLPPSGAGQRADSPARASRARREEECSSVAVYSRWWRSFTRDQWIARHSPGNPMRILIGAFGSRGDVQPMLALALALRADRHRVTV